MLTQKTVNVTQYIRLSYHKTGYNQALYPSKPIHPSFI